MVPPVAAGPINESRLFQLLKSGSKQVKKSKMVNEAQSVFGKKDTSDSYRFRADS